LIVFMLLLVCAAGAFGCYWLIRLAVRHGIEDAWLRREQRDRENAADSWDPARY